MEHTRHLVRHQSQLRGLAARLWRRVCRSADRGIWTVQKARGRIRLDCQADVGNSLPIWLWPQLITMCMIIGCCYAPGFESFTAFRSLQGLFGTIPQVIGLPIIHDMYAPKGNSILPSLFQTPG